MKFLIDMNLSPRWAEALRSRNFEATHWSKVGRPALDQELIEWAADRDFIVVTADLDFPAILAWTGRGHPSVILLRSDDLAPETLLPLFADALERAQPELESGAILTIDTAGFRIRLLPLTP